MPTTGKITHWNVEKGYGFITPSSGAKQVFVHISAFSDRNLQPKLNELVTFTLSTDRQGRPCAAQISRAGDKPHRVARRIGNMRSPVGGVAMMLVAAILVGSYLYSKYQQWSVNSSSPASTLSSPNQAALSKFKCDGRTHCSNMRSCEEALFFIKNCPGTKMDGDGDGVPCERQWCG